MRLFAIGDIHGCATALDVILKAIQLQPQDRLVTLGDYLNKGPDTRRVFDRLIALHRAGYLIPLRGNHELKLLQAGLCGSPTIGETTLVDRHTLASYGGDPTDLSVIPAAHWNFVRHNCLDWWESATHFFVHATTDPNRPLHQQTAEKLFWEKFNHPRPHMSGKIMVCGHTPQFDGVPCNVGHAICLDTWACGEGWLSCLEIGSGKLYQANQQYHFRTAHIADYLRYPVVA